LDSKWIPLRGKKMSGYEEFYKIGCKYVGWMVVFLGSLLSLGLLTLLIMAIIK